MKHKFVLFFLLTTLSNLYATPRLTVVFVVDQLASHYLKKLNNNLSGGIKTLIDNGVVYANAYHPIAKPSTAPGHVSIATGTVPALHGIVSNAWHENNAEVKSDANNSAKNLPTLSQQFLAAHPHNRSYALSLKSRSAIGLAGNSASAIWMDKNTGKFISNRNYFSSPPPWLTKFNHDNPLLSKPRNSWQLAYDDPKYYNFPCIDNYQYSRLKTLFNKKNLFKRSKSPHTFVKQFMLTPDSNKVLLELGQTTIQETFDNNPDANLLLWIGLSSLDKVGHRFGPHSREAIDMIYHLDQQLATFMQHAQAFIPTKDILYVLTADHGIMPIPELLEQCYDARPGQRILMRDVKHLINNDIKQLYGVKHIINALPAPYVYLDQEKLNKLPSPIQFSILSRIKELLAAVPGIKNVYSIQDLCLQAWKQGDTKWLFANQLYPRRNGHFALEVHPGVLLTQHTKGAGHLSPHEYNLHVPLILYQPGHTQAQTILPKVWIPQLTRTLANTLNIPAPSPTAMAALPE